jgi:hypothetical protein
MQFITFLMEKNYKYQRYVFLTEVFLSSINEVNNSTIATSAAYIFGRVFPEATNEYNANAASLGILSTTRIISVLVVMKKQNTKENREY